MIAQIEDIIEDDSSIILGDDTSAIVPSANLINSLNAIELNKKESIKKNKKFIQDFIKERLFNKIDNYKNSSSYILRNKLILDSGASSHFTPNKDWLLNYKPISNKSVIIANGSRLAIKGIGEIPIILNNNEFYIQDVYYVPEIHTTLISSKELTSKG